MNIAAHSYNLGEREKLDLRSREHLCDPRIAQGANLLEPLAQIHRLEVLDGGRVAAELRDSRRQLGERRKEPADGDRLRDRLAVRGLPIEAPRVTNASAEIP